MNTFLIANSDVLSDSMKPTIMTDSRIIGISGDTIDITDGRIYLNGSDTPFDEPYIAEEMEQQEVYHFEVPEDSYFMMGDNRNNSSDARYWRNHDIAKDKINAKVLFEYYPKIKRLY